LNDLIGLAVATSFGLVGAGVAPPVGGPFFALALAFLAILSQVAAVIVAPAISVFIHATTAALSVVAIFLSRTSISRLDSAGRGVAFAGGFDVRGVVTNRPRIIESDNSMGRPDRFQLSTADCPPRLNSRAAMCFALSFSSWDGAGVALGVVGSAFLVAVVVGLGFLVGLRVG